MSFNSSCIHNAVLRNIWNAARLFKTSLHSADESHLRFCCTDACISGSGAGALEASTVQPYCRIMSLQSTSEWTKRLLMWGQILSNLGSVCLLQYVNKSNSSRLRSDRSCGKSQYALSAAAESLVTWLRSHLCQLHLRCTLSTFLPLQGSSRLPISVHIKRLQSLICDLILVITFGTGQTALPAIATL